jgi:hypothetical protein
VRQRPSHGWVEVALAPDFFARTAAGDGVVIDCRPPDLVKERDATAFQATTEACAAVGWHYRLLGTPDAVVRTNVRWLAGYRHPRHHDDTITAALDQRFAEPAGLLVGADDVGDPIKVLPGTARTMARKNGKTHPCLPDGCLAKPQVTLMRLGQIEWNRQADLSERSPLGEFFGKVVRKSGFWRRAVDMSEMEWRKSTRSTVNGCVEVAFADGRIAVRDSKDRQGAVLTFTPHEWDAFVSGVRDGEFDLAK